MDVRAVVDAIAAVAEKVAPLASALGAPAGVLDAADAVIELIDHATETFGETDAAALAARRDALEAAVNAHADRTVEALEGKS